MTTLLQDAGQQFTANTTFNLSLTTSAGSTLVVVAAMRRGSSGTISAVTDSAGNTWTEGVTTFVSGINSRLSIWYVENAAAITSITVTASVSVAVSLNLLELDATNGVDTSGTASNTSSTSQSGGSVTTSGDAFLITGIAYDTAGVSTSSVSAGYTETPHGVFASTGSTGMGLAAATRATTGTGTFGATFTMSGATTAGGAVLAFAVPPAPAITVGASTTSTSHTLAKPTGVADGDYLIALGWGQADPTDPAGWTRIVQSNYTSTYYLTAWYHYVSSAASEPAGWTFTGVTIGGVTAVSGVDPTTPLDTTPVSSTLTLTLPSQTTVTDGALLVAGVMESATITPPASMTEQWAVLTGAVHVDLTTEARPTAGATGTRTFSGGGTGYNILGFALRPVSPATLLAASVVGAGTMTVAAVRETHPLATDLVGAGTLAGSLTVAVTLAAALTGAGTLVGTLDVFAPLAVDLIGAGVLAGTITVFAPLAADLVGVGVLTVPAVHEDHPLAVVIVGSGSLTARAVRETHPLAALLAGDGTVLAALAPIPLSDHVIILAGSVFPVIGTKRPPQYLGNRTIKRK